MKEKEEAERREREAEGANDIWKSGGATQAEQPKKRTDEFEGCFPFPTLPQWSSSLKPSFLWQTTSEDCFDESLLILSDSLKSKSCLYKTPTRQAER